jgi:hypothetical protein
MEDKIVNFAVVNTNQKYTYDITMSQKLLVLMGYVLHVMSHIPVWKIAS